jgi:hypothetical protein
MGCGESKYGHNGIDSLLQALDTQCFETLWSRLAASMSLRKIYTKQKGTVRQR